MKNVIAIAFALGMSACATPEPQIKIETVEVKVPVAVDCVPAELPRDPGFKVTREHILSAPTTEARLLLLGAALLERDARLAETEPVLNGCRVER